jgi:segregation and condensation protein A
VIAPHAGNGLPAASDAPASAESGLAGFLVELPAFAGPLDLLLSLIRDEQVDIYDIPIARIAQQFLGRIKDLGLDEAADYLEMAARLLRIKAQMLLPRNEQEEGWEDPRSELVKEVRNKPEVRAIVEADVWDERGEARTDQRDDASEDSNTQTATRSAV